MPSSPTNLARGLRCVEVIFIDKGRQHHGKWRIRLTWSFMSYKALLLGTDTGIGGHRAVWFGLYRYRYSTSSSLCVLNDFMFHYIVSYPRCTYVYVALAPYTAICWGSCHQIVATCCFPKQRFCVSFSMPNAKSIKSSKCRRIPSHV
jgi:hypothetical protein